ncbi:MAG: ATP-binding protein [Burkholderiaceae bacterium]|nr:ATP-binding protein [Microbacteriaceae bacterium]
MSNSPFRPGYSRMPLVFGGHERTVREFENVFQNFDIGENQSVLVSGLRGAGKTSMLGTLGDLAAAHGWTVIREDAGTGLLSRVMDSRIPQILGTFDRDTRMRLTRLGIWEFTADFDYVERKREVTPLLRDDLAAIAQATDDRGILVLVDEVSSRKSALDELSRFALELSHAIAEGLNIVVVFAGVKIELDELLAQPHLTFLRRSRQLIFRRLSAEATRRVIRETTEAGGRKLALDAEEHLITTSQGYPYLVQLVGDYAWRNNPDADGITLEDAESAREKAISEVEERVISRVYRDLSEKDREFLQAMSPDDGVSKMGSIADRMGVSPQYANIYKQRLIDSGYVQMAGRGFVDFSLPYLREYVRTVVSTTSASPREPDNGGWDEFPPPKR